MNDNLNFSETNPSFRVKEREEGRDLWDGVLEVLKQSGTGEGGG